jgi:hypothetical protein
VRGCGELDRSIARSRLARVAHWSGAGMHLGSLIDSLGPSGGRLSARTRVNSRPFSAARTRVNALLHGQCVPAKNRALGGRDGGRVDFSFLREESRSEDGSDSQPRLCLSAAVCL